MARTTLNRIITLFIITLFSCNVNAANYVTINNGNWNDIINVWSTDGGITPCGCSPGTPIGNNNIVINHDVVMTTNLVFDNGSVTVNAAGTLTGGKNINTWNNTFDVYGFVSIGKYNQGALANSNMHPGAILFASGAFEIVNGIFTMNGALVNSGRLGIYGPGTLNLTNSSRYLVVSGNAVNEGMLNIGPLSCMSSNGNWKNNGTGTVAGSGSLNSGGNLQNFGTFSMATAWCAQGAAMGLPTPEDCTTSDGICNAITLPVELVNFFAEPVEKDYIEIFWETASENNSSHFIIESSQDGKNWEEVGIVDAAGNSTEANYYSLEDYNVNYGITYYRLIQVDNDSRTFESDIISVLIEGEEVEIGVYPNPIRNNEMLTITNLEESPGQINVLNLSGQIIESQDIDGNAPTAKLLLRNLNPGVYFVNIEQLGNIKTKRLVITE